MNSSPSCNRIAASKLVATCQSIGGKSDSMDTGTYVMLEHVRSLYAARLAICELNGAGTPTPTTCLQVTVAMPRKKGIFGFSSRETHQLNYLDTTTAENLEPCLKSLESRPQWWTSYSNSRQNAVVICQASRIEGEREEVLELYRSIIESSVKLSHGLQEALRMASEASAQHKDFIQTTEALRVTLAQEVEETRFRLQSALESIFKDAESGVISILATIQSAFGDIHTEVTALGQDVHNATSRVRQLQDTLNTIQSETLARDQEMVALHKRNSLAHHELASSLHNKLDTVLHKDVAGLSHRVETMDSSLEWLTGKFVLLLQHEQTLTERLRDMEISLDISQLKASDLHKAQVKQLETIKAQSRLQETLQTSMQNSQALIAKTAVATANLEAMVDAVAAKYKESLAINSLFDTTLWAMSIVLSFVGPWILVPGLLIIIVGALRILTTKIF
ncbi:hypothetical protein FE257_006110 [Aspergillus nanangensis]|uniref:Uncharacterized protein n=1 Tax=Aspergillus nanangensis TaxID=2582783 RepID=A0AAD4CPU8_ASPNN|nr:hypothetical protein FE257_006110 [Aspergillus nanangensis]